MANRLLNKLLAWRSVRQSSAESANKGAPAIVPAQVRLVVYPSLPHGFLHKHIRRKKIDVAFLGLFTIHADGSADVRMLESTGWPVLDGLALEAARKWTFAPATVDGVPADSYLRLRVEFDVR